MKRSFIQKPSIITKKPELKPTYVPKPIETAIEPYEFPSNEEPPKLTPLPV